MAVLRCFALVLGLLAPGPALAADNGGPPLTELMMRPNYPTAYKTMIGTTTVPGWVSDFAKTLDGPPTPSTDILAGGTIYTLGFTCKPNDCSNNQLYVLFRGDGSQAWGMLVEGDKRGWLGAPDDKIKETISGHVE
jgi:hypothetical protein